VTGLLSSPDQCGDGKSREQAISAHNLKLAKSELSNNLADQSSGRVSAKWKYSELFSVDLWEHSTHNNTTEGSGLKFNTSTPGTSIALINAF